MSGYAPPAPQMGRPGTLPPSPFQGAPSGFTPQGLPPPATPTPAPFPGNLPPAKSEMAPQSTPATPSTLAPPASPAGTYQPSPLTTSRSGINLMTQSPFYQPPTPQPPQPVSQPPPQRYSPQPDLHPSSSFYGAYGPRGEQNFPHPSTLTTFGQGSLPPAIEDGAVALQRENEALLLEVQKARADNEMLGQKLQETDTLFKSRLSLLTDNYRVFKQFESVEKQARSGNDTTEAFVKAMGGFRDTIGKHFTDVELGHLGSSRHFFPAGQAGPSSPKSGKGAKKQ